MMGSTKRVVPGEPGGVPQRCHLSGYEPGSLVSRGGRMTCWV